MVTAVVVTHNSGRVIEGCLRSLCDQDGLVDRTIVVDNESHDDTLEVIRRVAPGAEIVPMGRNAGYAAAVNAGVERSKGSVLVLNPDVRLQSGCVAALLEVLEQPATGIVVPMLRGPGGDLRYSLRREPMIRRALGEAVLGGHLAGRVGLGEMITAPARYSAPTEADWASGAVMLISDACLAEVGPWDESYFLYSEETDFALRARDAGWSLRYTPAARAVHIEGDFQQSPELWALLVNNRVAHYRARHGRLRAMPFRVALVLGEMLRWRDPVRRAALAALLSPWGAVSKRSRLQTSRPPYVCFAGVDWWYSNRAHSDFQLMTRVARDTRVLFVNSIGVRMPRPGRSTHSAQRIARKMVSTLRFLRRPVEELPMFSVLSPIVLPFYGTSWGRRINASLVRAQLRTVMALLGMSDPVFVATLPTAWPVLAPLPRRSLVVNKADKYSSWAEVDRRYIAGLEDTLLGEADRVMYVSRAMMASDQPLVGGRAVFLDHGVDLEHFERCPPEEIPSDLASIPGPRLGFFGSIDDYKVDFELLEQLARELPETSVVLIGDATCSMERLSEIPNVHWLGPRPYEQIPRYGSGFDVGLMPYLDNEWIRNSNPIKLKEYLALGLPSVCSPLPEARYYEPLVHVAADRDDFVRAVRVALDEAARDDHQVRETRRAAVSDCSWDACARTLTGVAESRIGPAERPSAQAGKPAY